jgi:hypothetical protein
MNVVFLILMHKNPAQTIRLIERLESPQSRFVVHVDSRASSAIFQPIVEWAAKRENVYCAKRHRCYWGNFGIVAATLECVQTAQKAWEMFDYAALLSGQDYPIKTTKSIFEFLANNIGKEFIDSFRLDQSNRWSEQTGPYQSMNRVSYYTLNFRSRKLHIPTRRSPPAGLRPYGGSQWWCLSRECLSFIDQFLCDNPKVISFFRNVFIPDEMVFQTVISNSCFGEAISPDLHYLDWARPNPFPPRTLDISDFDRLCSSDKLFARKFDVDKDITILDLIDREILLAG